MKVAENFIYSFTSSKQVFSTASYNSATGKSFKVDANFDELSKKRQKQTEYENVDS